MAATSPPGGAAMAEESNDCCLCGPNVARCWWNVRRSHWPRDATGCGTAMIIPGAGCGRSGRVRFNSVGNYQGPVGTQARGRQIRPGAAHEMVSALGPLVIQNYGAGDGNRTHVASLEGWGFTTKLRPLGTIIISYGEAMFR